MTEGGGWKICLWTAILLHFAFFLTIGMSRYWGHMSSIDDLGVFDQVIWSTLNGNILQTTINPFGTPINWLGFHFQPVLLLFVPLYALTPTVTWLIIAQAAALSLAAWPLYLLAHHIFKSHKSGLIWALVYLANPFLLSADTWDFHPITLAVPFISLGFLAVAKNNARLLLLSCLILLTCKEHLGLAVAGFGILWWLKHRGWRTPLILTTMGVGHLILVLCFIMPAFSPTDTPAMLSEQLGQASRYSWLGTSLTEVLHTLLTQPDYVWQNVINMGGWIYWGGLLMPFLYIFPILGFPLLLPGLADLAANTLSANAMPRGLWSYHSASLIPVLVAAAIDGVKRISLWQNKVSTQQLSGLVLATSLVFGYFLLPLPLMGTFNFWAPSNVLNWPASEVQTIRQVVGDKASLSVQANIGAYFTQRLKIYTYPVKAVETDAIVLRLKSPTTNINALPENIEKGSRKDIPSWLDGHLQMDRTEYVASIDRLLAKSEYGILIWDDPWLVLSRGADNSRPEAKREVHQLLMKLRSEWQIDEAEYQTVMDRYQRLI
jgi:uncharacterized membrane protein